MNISAIRFLVVDDHEFQRNMLVRMLKRLGAQSIAEASDGTTALEYCMRADDMVDVILCDLDMPGMDGMAFIRAPR
jgi:CheY-like chemotaxis protein